MDRLKKAKIQLLINNPFFGYLASSLESRKIDKTNAGGPLGTDGKYLYYVEEALNSFSDDVLEACVAHEVMHCALGHLWRKEVRHQMIWNLATDAVINTELKTCGFNVPDFAFFGDPEWRHLSAEEIYEKLINSVDMDKNIGRYANKKVGDHESWKKANGMKEETKRKANQEKWKRRAINARQMLKEHGKLPASLNRLIENLIQPKLPWHILLRRYIRRHERFDYSWRKLNKRLQPHGIIYPSITGKQLKIAICVDTSGSITQEQLKKFMSEIQGILRAVKKVEILLYVSDVDIKERFPKTITDVNELKSSLVDLRGGGGTSFEPVFEDSQLQQYQVLVYLTDCRGTYPKEAPDLDVIWVCNEKKEQLSDWYKPPFGQLVELT